MNVVQDLAIQAFQQLIRKMKTSSIARPIAYFYGIVTKKFEEQYYEELYEMGFSAYEKDVFAEFFYKK